MSSNPAITESANGLPPLLNSSAKNRTRAISTSVTSAINDLSSLLTDVEKGHFVSFQADGGKIYFALNNANSGTIDQAAVDGTNTAQQCGMLVDGEVKSFRIVKGYKYLLAKAATGTPTLRVWISSFLNQDEVA